MKTKVKVPIETFKHQTTAIHCDTCSAPVANGEQVYEVRASLWAGETTMLESEQLDFCSYPCLTEHMNRYFRKDSRYIPHYDIEQRKAWVHSDVST